MLQYFKLRKCLNNKFCAPLTVFFKGGSVSASAVVHTWWALRKAVLVTPISFHGHVYLLQLSLHSSIYDCKYKHDMVHACFKK